MKQKKSSFPLWLVIPIILAALLIQAGPVAGATITSRSWKVVPTRNVATINNALNGVSAISSSNAWAVGYSWNNNTNTSQTLIEHWNGTRWNIVPSPNPNPTSNRLNAVTALSATNVWAVGSAIEHWNGTKWAVVANPDPGANLFAVAASSGTDVWAVGDYFISFDPPHNVTLVLHWNGIQWTVVPSPSPTNSFNVLHSVGAVSSKDVWAVGNMSRSNDPNTNRTMIQHWNGTKWSVVSSPNHSIYNNALLSVTVISATNIWAVGSYSNGTPSNQTLTEQWNGTKWRVA